MSMSIAIAGIEFAHPIFAAAGCAGTGRELPPQADLAGFGAVITRSITAEPRAGLPSPRIAETPAGLVNALGLPGPGVEQFLTDELPWLVDRGIPVIASIAADSAADYARLAQRLRQAAGILAIEVNLSNPVVEPGRFPFAMEAGAAGGVVHAVRRNTAVGVPVFAKLAGDTTDIVGVARACAGAGADGLSLINAVRAMGIDATAEQPSLGATIGGLSGPAIKPIALRAVWEVHAAMPDVPIIASGGVRTGADAAEMMMAGATAVSVGTALLNDPAAGTRVRDELADIAARREGGLPALLGCAHQEERV